MDLAGWPGTGSDLLGRDEEALRSFRLALEANPNSTGTYALLAAACALTGRDDEARAALARYLSFHPRATVTDFRRLRRCRCD